MKETKGLFRHKISDHVGSTDKERFHITALSVMPAEVTAHIDVTSSGLFAGCKLIGMAPRLSQYKAV